MNRPSCFGDQFDPGLLYYQFNCARCEYKQGCKERTDKMSELAVKADNDKPTPELLPFEALVEVSAVLAYGQRKYAAHNWRNGMLWSRLLGAALRHIFAWAAGENQDPETGRSHLAHACC